MEYQKYNHMAKAVGLTLGESSEPHSGRRPIDSLMPADASLLKPPNQTADNEPHSTESFSLSARRGLPRSTSLCLISYRSQELAGIPGRSTQTRCITRNSIDELVLMELRIGPFVAGAPLRCRRLLEEAAAQMSAWLGG